MGPLIPLLWTSGDVCPGSQSQDGSLACMLCHLCTTHSPNSPPVQHLLNSWRPTWHLSLFDPRICTVQSYRSTRTVSLSYTTLDYCHNIIPYKSRITAGTTDTKFTIFARNCMCNKSEWPNQWYLYIDYSWSWAIYHLFINLNVWCPVSSQVTKRYK